MSIIPAGHCLDPKLSYPTRKVKPFAHSNATVVRHSNGLHYTLEGGKQVGDAFAAWLLCNL